MFYDAQVLLQGQLLQTAEPISSSAELHGSCQCHSPVISDSLWVERMASLSIPPNPLKLGVAKSLTVAKETEEQKCVTFGWTFQ